MILYLLDPQFQKEVAIDNVADILNGRGDNSQNKQNGQSSNSVNCCNIS